MDREELAAWLRLELTPGVGRAGTRRLLARFGLPPAIFSQPLSALREVVSEAQAQALLQTPPELAERLQTTLRWLQEDPDKRRLLTLGDPLYPRALLDTEDPPALLYALGAARLWEAGGLNQPACNCLAMVGSRNPTPQGLANARQFALALAQGGMSIVSGLALGIDGAAHEGALECADPHLLPTVAVVGTGLDRVYPRQHQVLAHRIAQRGLLLSEFPLGTPPAAAHFPQRNRIIAGLSRGTLVVEAALQSGSLITARLAAEQGREVFAIPGSIHAPQSRGCHALIKQGAKLVESAQDVLEELLPLAAAGAARAAVHDAAAPPLSPVLAALGQEVLRLDALQARTGLDTASLQAELMTLELEGHVARLPGGLFQHVVRG